MVTPTVCLYVDAQNVQLNQSEASALLSFVSTKGQVRCKKLYYNSQSSSQNSKKLWESCALTCVNVPCPLKNSADNQLVFDCIFDNSTISPDLFVIVSGDGDFLSLVNTLQQLNKTVIVIARKGNVKQKLIENAQEFRFIDELKISHSELFDANSITYKDAIRCLIKAIKIANSRGKRTTFAVLGHLMRESQDFPEYRGVSSICRSNGEKFSGFKQFINAVAQDGLVRVQNSGIYQEVVLLKAT